MLSLSRCDRSHSLRFLMQDITAGVKAQYGALVFDDPVLVRLAGPSGPPSNDTGRSRIGSTELQALLAAALPGALAGALPQDTLGAAFGGASGQAAVLSFLLSKEATVLRRMQARLRDHLPIHLMHNASSQHALPSLLSGSFPTNHAAQCEFQSDCICSLKTQHSTQKLLPLKGVLFQGCMRRSVH